MLVEAAASKILKKAVFYSFIIEIALQLISLIAPTFLLSGTHHGSRVLLAALFLLAYYLYCVSLMLFAGLVVRSLPKPSFGEVQSESELLKYALVYNLYKFVRRSPARWLASLLPSLFWLFFRLAGGTIGRHTVVCSVDSIQDPHLISIGSSSLIGFDARLIGLHWVDQHTCLVGRVEVEQEVTIGRGATLLPNVKVGRGATVQESATVVPGTVIPPGEVWGGTPARMVAPGD